MPATIANLGPGFDALGMAVDLYDRFRVAIADRAAVVFSGESAGEISRIPTPLVARAAEAVTRRAGRDAVFAIDARLAIPVARGLGSSAASIVGGLVAANHLLGNPLDRSTLLEMAAELDRPDRPPRVQPSALGRKVLALSAGSTSGMSGR